MKDVAAKVFNSVSKRYDSFLNAATFGFIHKWQDELLSKTPLKETILDVGTGTGEIVKKVLQKSPSSTVIGIDVAKEMVKQAKRKNISATFIIADATKLPIKNSTADNLIFSLTYRHIPQEKLLDEIDRVLKKEGTVSILDIPKPPAFLYYLVLFFMEKVFRKFGEKLFSQEEYDYFLHSVKFAPSFDEIRQRFKERNYKEVYSKKRLFGLISLFVFQKN